MITDTVHQAREQASREAAGLLRSSGGNLLLGDHPTGLGCDLTGNPTNSSRFRERVASGSKNYQINSY
jgi:hypothetical protein